MSASKRYWFQRPESLISLPVLGLGLLGAPHASAEIVVQLDELRQRIDGFGASSAFFSEDISQEDADFLFDVEQGIGLSLMRVRINHQDNDTTDIETAKKAYAHGARVWAAPWTPPPEYKTNNALPADPGNGHLKTSSYADFASYLADFAEWMEAQGVPLTAITPQNEPDWPATWDGCLYSASEMTNFIGKYLGPEFEARGLDDVLIVAPDTAHLKNLPGFADALVADADVMKYLDGISTHPYSEEGFSYDWSLPRDNHLFFWQTEVSWESFNEGPNVNDTPDPGMKTALWMVKMLHSHLTQLWMNSWSYWNLTAVEDDYADDTKRKNPALIQDGVKFKRAYVMGNYSKFVRPGFLRVEATPAPATDLYVSAYKSSERVVVVAINDSNAAVSQTIKLTGELGGTVGSAVPWVTSDQLALAEQAPLAIDSADNSFEASLAPKSVTSFVVDVDVPGPTGSGGSAGMGGAAGTFGSEAGAAGATATGGTGVATAGASGAPPSGAGGLGTGGGGAIASGGGGGIGVTSRDDPSATTDAGCGCRVVTTRSSRAPAIWALALSALAVALRRRRGRRDGAPELVQI